VKIKAAVLYKPKEKIVVEEVELMPPKANEVLVRIKAAGVCHSDLARIKGERYSKYPVVLGHEGCGIVESIGENVTRVKPGDKVVLSWVSPCGKCYYCCRGLEHLCLEHYNYYIAGTLPEGSTRLKKGTQEIYHFQCLSMFAEYAIVPESACITIPKNIPAKYAAVVGCAVMTGIGSVWNTANVLPGSSVVVFGVGGVGLNCIQGAHSISATPIIAVDVNDKKLETAKKFGATDLINAKKQDTLLRVKELTGNIGADYAFVAVGNSNVIEQAYECVRRQGTVVVVGMAPMDQKISINALSIPYDEKIIKGSFYGSPNLRVDFNRIIDLYEKNVINLKDLISRTYPLEKINEAFDDLEKGELTRGVLVIEDE